MMMVWYMDVYYHFHKLSAIPWLPELLWKENPENYNELTDESLDRPPRILNTCSGIGLWSHVSDVKTVVWSPKSEDTSRFP